jgi:hypothetical protein
MHPHHPPDRLETDPFRHQYVLAWRETGELEASLRIGLDVDQTLVDRQERNSTSRIGAWHRDLADNRPGLLCSGGARARYQHEQQA